MWERPFIRTMAEWLDVASRSREMEALTTDEWVAFEGSYYDPIQKPASINVLEYFVVMHMITYNAERLRGSIVYVSCDNTAGICWLNRLRGSKLSDLSLALLRAFALIVQTCDIEIEAFHILRTWFD